jgi:hypothetical protein
MLYCVLLTKHVNYRSVSSPAAPNLASIIKECITWCIYPCWIHLCRNTCTVYHLIFARCGVWREDSMLTAGLARGSPAAANLPTHHRNYYMNCVPAAGSFCGKDTACTGYVDDRALVTSGRETAC